MCFNYSIINGNKKTIKEFKQRACFSSIWPTYVYDHNSEFSYDKWREDWVLNYYFDIDKSYIKTENVYLYLDFLKNDLGFDFAFELEKDSSIWHFYIPFQGEFLWGKFLTILCCLRYLDKNEWGAIQIVNFFVKNYKKYKNKLNLFLLSHYQRYDYNKFWNGNHVLSSNVGVYSSTIYKISKEQFIKNLNTKNKNLSFMLENESEKIELKKDETAEKYIS